MAYAIAFKNTVYGKIEGTETIRDGGLITPMYSNLLRITEMRYKTRAAAEGQLTKKGWNIQRKRNELDPFTMYVERIRKNCIAIYEVVEWVVIDTIDLDD